jgi:predicted nucleic acid-binding protein
VTRRPIVCDTTVLLYLGRIDQIDLLPALSDPVLVPTVRPLVDAAAAEGFHASPDLYRDTLKLADEAM